MFIAEIAAFLFTNHCNSTSNIKFSFFLGFNLLNLQFACQEQKAADVSYRRQLSAFSVPAAHAACRRFAPWLCFWLLHLDLSYTNLI